MAEAALAFGSNLGDRAVLIAEAQARLLARGDIRKIAASGLYETPPWGVAEQPEFLNACLLVDTQLSPEALLAACQAVEAELGRERSLRWGPRRIDIDVLWVGDLVRDMPKLTLPHPRLTERAFVLVPLAEIAPDRIVAGATVREHLAACDTAGVRPYLPRAAAP